MNGPRIRGARPFLVGVVHLAATPGAPRYGGEVGTLLERATADARALAGGGCDALLVENLGDV
ncbi:MAG TPA: BtpA/SgcQ family protein, partial [Planctomycetota bacterium]|nr:BtpA/SgcQ family protein [Planctomycetota bacterium]